MMDEIIQETSISFCNKVSNTVQHNPSHVFKFLDEMQLHDLLLDYSDARF